MLWGVSVGAVVRRRPLPRGRKLGDSIGFRDNNVVVLLKHGVVSVALPTSGGLQPRGLPWDF